MSSPTSPPPADYTISNTSSSSWLKRVLFLGTGTSGQVPAIHCLTGPGTKDGKVNCHACRDALNPDSKNRRGCTSVALLGGGESKEEQSLILIDVGVTFYASALRHFRNQGFHKIRAVLLTHAHADAILGLDNLRAWTLGNVIQDYIDVYLTKECSETVFSTFPYLKDNSKATGGGGVGALRWHIIDDDKPFKIQDKRTKKEVEIIPLPTLHGFSNGSPFQCLGFRIDDFSYVSDCHEIPKTTTDLMIGSQCAVIDALKYDKHPSHFSVPQAISLGLSLSNPSPPLLLLTDLTHKLEHNSLENQLRQFVIDLRNWVDEVENGSEGEGKKDIEIFKKSFEPSLNTNLVKREGKEYQDSLNHHTKVLLGEGNHMRWWRSIWNEDRSERTLNLNLSEKSLHTAPADNEKKTSSLAKELVPDFHVAYDGMSIDFS